MYNHKAMNEKNESITISMKTSDLELLKRLREAMTEEDGDPPAISSVMRRGMRLLARKMKVE